MPTAVSETLGTRWSFRDLMARGDPGVVIFDPAWVGGITESKAIARWPRRYRLPVAPHDCTGPGRVRDRRALWRSTPPTRLFQEIVRAFYTGWYRELVTEVPRVEDGYVYPLTGPGLGTELLPEVPSRPDAVVRVSQLGD